MKRSLESLPFDSLSSDDLTTSKHVYSNVIRLNFSNWESRHRWSLFFLRSIGSRKFIMFRLFSHLARGNRVEIFIWRYRSVIITVASLPHCRLSFYPALSRRIIICIRDGKPFLFFVPTFLSFALSSAGFFSLSTRYAISVGRRSSRICNYSIYL